MGTVTLKDLAKELNLSVNTVSRALRDMPDIGRETKEIVRKAAESMNYRINLNAAALRTNRSKTIGAIVSDISNPVFAGMIKGISVKCREAGYTMLLANTSENYEEELEAVRSMLQHKVDGIILFPSMKGKGPVQELLAKKIPFILVGRYFSEISTNVVVNDDVLGGNIAAEHLFGRGHSSFLYIAGDLQISSSRERLEGFRQFLATRGLGPGCVRVCETDATWRGGYT
ncbi:MAG: LacI family DNA-binding transcriptional regulator, partial [Eubacteriales bacterium]|nr:LacI family DNA-binding transcriptional regulator [Eubacteriales bacterium]